MNNHQKRTEDRKRWSIISNQRWTKDDGLPSRTIEGQSRIPIPTKDNCKRDAQAVPLQNGPACQLQKKHPGSVMPA